MYEIRVARGGDVRVNEMALFSSGTSNVKHEHGVGFLVVDHLLPYYVTIVNDRICQIREAGKQYDIILICVHSPAEAGAIDSKDKLYNELERVRNNLLILCTKIIRENFNSLVRREIMYKPTIGNKSVPNKSNENDILHNHILIDYVHRSCIKDASSIRRTDGESNHVLVLVYVKIIL